MACYWLFRFSQVTKSQNVLTYKFTINQLLQRTTSIIISGTAFLNHKVGQVVSQSWVGNTKQGSFYYKVRQLLLQGGTIITKQCSTEGR